MDFDKSIFVGVDEPVNTIQYEVSQIHPNPATTTVKLMLKLEKSSDITVSVVNLMGQRVNIINMGTLNAGNNPISLDVSNLPSGIYYCVVQVNGEKTTQKMIVQ